MKGTTERDPRLRRTSHRYSDNFSYTI